MELYYLGLDLGGTYFRAVTCDAKGQNMSEIKKAKLVRTDQVETEAENNLFSVIDSVCNEHHRENKTLAGIGISMAALFDRDTGRVENWPNNDKWNGFPILRYLTDRYNVPVVIEDDANSAALGEQLNGSAKGLENFIYVTISTGIGSGIVVNNELLTGKHGWAGELGHIRVSDEKIVCTCGAEGCLQALASGPAIVRRFRKAMAQKCLDTDIELKDIVRMAESGIKEAVDSFVEAGTYIGNALANLVILLDVPVVVLGGGVMNAGHLILKPIREAMYASLASRREAKLILSSLGDKNGVIGALSLILRYVKDNNTGSLI